MAKKATGGSSISYANVISEIRAGRIAPVYLLSGEESYFIDRISELLAEKVVPEPEARDFDQSVFFGSDTDVKTVADAARRFPVMGDRQLVMLKEAQTLDNARNQLDSLAPYCDHPVPTTVWWLCSKANRLRVPVPWSKG